MEIANIHEAKSQLSRLVDHAMDGEEVIIARAGHPIVRLVPIRPDARPPRRPVEGPRPHRRRLRRPARRHRRRLRHGAAMTLLARHPRLPLVARRPAAPSKAARKAIGDGKNTVYVSAAVAWEIAIKKALGKLDAPDDLEAAMAANRFLPLPSPSPTPLPCSPARPSTATPSTACSSPRRGTRASSSSAATRTCLATAWPISSRDRRRVRRAVFRRKWPGRPFRRPTADLFLQAFEQAGAAVEAREADPATGKRACRADGT